MPIKSSKKSKKETTEENLDDSASSYLDIESEAETDVGQIEFDVNCKIQATHSSVAQNLNEFFSDQKMINGDKDPSTNIIDRLKGQPYKVPDKKLPRMFKLMELCRRGGINMMYSEKQQEPSGIMLDFDIYQPGDKDQLTDELFYSLSLKIAELLKKMLKFDTTKKKEVFYIGITRRQSITLKQEEDAYKDGFHLLIPEIKISRGMKRLLIQKLKENEIIDQIFSEVEPAKLKTKIGYQRTDFLDSNSAHVVTFFVGNSTKKGNKPYVLSHIYKMTIQFDTDQIMVERNSELLSSKSFNTCHEFSLNYECPDGLFKKRAYEPIEKYASEVVEMSKPIKDEEEQITNFGLLSMNSIHDVQINEIKNLLDTFTPRRAHEYSPWYNVLCALANTSSSYRDLAEYFSRKSPKFNMIDFEKFWSQALRGPIRGRKPYTLGSLHFWAKQDNPGRYEQIRKEMAYQVLYNMAYEPYREGILSHADVAEIVYRVLKFKYVTDVPVGERKRVWYEFIIDEDDKRQGELYKWRKWSDELPVSLMRYISETLPNLFSMVLSKIKKNYDDSTGDLSKWYQLVLKNFKASMRKLGDRTFKKNVVQEAELKFSKCGFSDTLDKNPIVRGVANGVLKLGHLDQPPQLIIGYHDYHVSKFTDVDYIPFNPYDPITKDILIKLRSMFPNNETDTFEFTMYFLASTLDGNPKESMIMLMVGGGSNGKSFLVELHRSAIGEIYGVKVPVSFLTAKSGAPDSATPAVMMLKDATFAYYSETDRHEILNAARMKEITGGENLAGRGLHKDMINFRPKCHHLVLSNNDFDIHAHDHGTWRRVVYNPLKIKFVDIGKGEKYDPTDPYQRIADSTLADNWKDDPDVRGRYLGFMVWMHFWLYKKYNGKVLNVPHPHIAFETEKFKLRQDTISAFLSQRLVKTEDEKSEIMLVDELQKYVNWYAKNQGGLLPTKGLVEMFTTSSLGKKIARRARGQVIVGHRFLDAGEKPKEKEEYAQQDVFEMEMSSDNSGVKAESPEEYYERVCKEYDQHKQLFTGEAKFNIDLTIPKIEKKDNMVELATAPSIRPDNIGHQPIPGILFTKLEEPNLANEEGKKIIDTVLDPNELCELAADLNLDDEIVVIDEDEIDENF